MSLVWSSCDFVVGNIQKVVKVKTMPLILPTLSRKGPAPFSKGTFVIGNEAKAKLHWKVVHVICGNEREAFTIMRVYCNPSERKLCNPRYDYERVYLLLKTMKGRQRLQHLSLLNLSDQETRICHNGPTESHNGMGFLISCWQFTI